MPLRRRKRRLLLAGFAVLFVGLMIELGGAFAWWIDTGEFFTWSRAAAARASVRDGSSATTDPDARVQRAAAHSAMLHPFLGFVHSGEDTPFPISDYGFYGTESPLRKRAEDRFLVAVTGGSVALHFGLYAEDLFAAALLRSPTLAGRTVEVVNLGLGGFKQPQQLLTIQLLLLLGGQFDCVVNLDGFNEVALVNENVPLGVPAWYPRSWARLLDTVPTPEQQRRLGHLVVLEEERRDRADSAGAWWWSPVAQFLWRWRDRDRAMRIAELRAEVERSAATPSRAITGPGTGGRSVFESRKQMAQLWQRTSRQLHSLCAQNGIRYYHFLQPNQYVPNSKPIGAAEAAVAIRPDHPWRAAVIEGYPQLRQAGRALREDGIAFTDLTQVFADHAEPLYTDTCCHFGRQGHAIIAEHIAAAIRRDFDLEDVEWQRLVVEPERIELSTPFAGARLRVTGIDQDGRAHDVSGAGFGARVTASPHESVVVGADGSVRAARRGSATITYVLEPAMVEVPFAAQWPDVFEGSDGRPDAGGNEPRLVVDADQVASGSPTVTVSVSGLTAARFRFVATAPRPLPESPIGAEHFGLHLVPVVGTGDAAQVVVPIAAAAGQPVFVRYYALGEDAVEVVAASRTIVITRG